MIVFPAIAWHFESSKLKEIHTVVKNNVIEFKNPEPFVDDPIAEILGMKLNSKSILRGYGKSLETISFPCSSPLYLQPEHAMSQNSR